MRMPVEMLVPSPVLFFWPQSLAPPLFWQLKGTGAKKPITSLYWQMSRRKSQPVSSCGSWSTGLLWSPTRRVIM